MQSFVVVKQLPESMVSSGAHDFFQELQPILRCNRPSLVFDFSRVSDFDAAGIHTLLRCLEEVMKRHGDLKLAALTPHAATILELTQIDRLFQIFTHPTEAVNSFAYCPLETARQSMARWNSQVASPDLCAAAGAPI